jgi:hypothetical protein
MMIRITDGDSNIDRTVTVNNIDTQAPVLTQVTPVPSYTSDTTPDYTFSTTEA